MAPKSIIVIWPDIASLSFATLFSLSFLLLSLPLRLINVTDVDDQTKG